MMRIVIDTNVLISGFLWDGPPNRIVHLLADKKFAVISSAELFDELSRVIKYERFSRRLAALMYTPGDIIEKYEEPAEFVPVIALDGPIIPEDPSDEMALRATLSGGASFIVTGDSHVLARGIFRHISIVNSVDFLRATGF